MIITTCTPQTHLAQLELIEMVFHPRMRHRYPWLLSEQNLNHRFVALDGDKVFGALNYWTDEVTLGGVIVTVASIGAVATHPDYRHQGIASQLLDFAEQAMRDEKVDVVVISGSIDLYLRYGAERLSSVVTFEIPPMERSITVVPTQGDHITQLKAMYDQNPFRFLRTERQMAELIEATSVPSNWMNTTILTVMEGNTPKAYAVVTRRPNKPGAWIREFGGEPTVLEALAFQIIQEFKVERVILELIHNDLLVPHLSQKGWPVTEEPMESTVKVLDFEALVNKLKPSWITENPKLEHLHIQQTHDTVVWRLDQEELITDVRTAQRILLGPWLESVDANHPILVQLKGILPIPWVYPSNLNYQ
jgi:predicted N-acetyltransferase YhbS